MALDGQAWSVISSLMDVNAQPVGKINKIESNVIKME